MNETNQYRKLLHLGTLLLRDYKPDNLQKSLFELLPEIIDMDGAALFIRSEKDHWSLRAASSKGILLKTLRPQLERYAKKLNEEGGGTEAAAAPLLILCKSRFRSKGFKRIAAFPLSAMGRIAAFIVVARNSDQDFTTDDLNGLDYLAAMLSTTLENQFAVQALQAQTVNLEVEKEDLKTEVDKLTREQEFASFLSKSAPYLVFVLNAKGKISFANPVCQEATGYGVEELIGRSFIDLLYPDKSKEKQEWFAALFKTREPQSFQTTLWGREGDPRIITWNAVKRTDAKGKATEVICIGKDETRSAHLEAQSQILFETLPDGLFKVNDRFEVVEVNKYTADLLGLDFKSLIGKKCYDTLCTESRETCPVFAGKGDDLTYESTIPAPGADKFHVLKSIRRYNLGGSEYAVETFKDISKLKGMERKIRDYAENLERKVEQRTVELKEVQRYMIQVEKLAATGRLAASIAHEINNPIYGIKGCLESVLEESKLPPEMEDYVKLSIRETDRISDLIKRMQNFHRETKGVRQPTDLHAILQDVLVLTNKFLQENKITLETEFATDLPEVSICPDEMKQVFFNLISNAVEAMTGKGTLTIKTAHKGNMVEILFKDTGCGIRKDVKGRIFDAFFTTKAAVKGVGLGLPVCWGIVRGQGGRITVESALRKGSSFIVSLPALKNARKNDASSEVAS